MSFIFDKMESIIPGWRDRVKKLVKEHGDKVLGNVTVAQAYGGMRGVKGLVCDTSYLDPYEGIRFRGYTIPEVLAKLPREDDNPYPFPLGQWYLLLTGEIPTRKIVDELQREFHSRQIVPKYIWHIIDSTPIDTHPMTQFAMAVLALQRESVFAKEYEKGIRKVDYWRPFLEDSMNLLAKLPVIAAYIYRRIYKSYTPVEPSTTLDWGANFAHMMGIENAEYKNLMRLYLILHSDHESGNVSAHTNHLVSSALSDTYYSVSAALDGLAGPLHGLANQECLKWILGLMKKFGGVPTEKEIEKFAWDTLDSGKVIPGYGHAVLRITDPRYTAQREFALKHLPDDPIFKTVSVVYKVVPKVLEKQGKAKNPWPNVDAHSGAIQYHYGVTQTNFYTVLFGVARALGVTAEVIWDRALGLSIERPKSVTTKQIEELVSK